MGDLSESAHAVVYESTTKLDSVESVKNEFAA